MSREILARLDRHDEQFADVKKHLNRLENELSRQGILAEARDHKIDLIAETVLHLRAELKQSRTVKAKVDDHEVRICSLEQTRKNS